MRSNFKNLVGLSLALLIGGAQAATLTGKANFKGSPPKPKKISMAADPNCVKLHKDEVMTEFVVVNKNNTLKNVFVYVKDGLTQKNFTAPTTPAVFDQRGCHYTPHVFGMMVGQPLEIINSDPTLHNVHAMPKNSKQFNAGMPMQGMKITRNFEKTEVMVNIKCDVHPWMKAYAGVLDHPFFAVTGEDGTAQIANLPAGKYTITAWHEKYGTKDMTVTVEEGKPANAEFTFEGTGEPAASN